MRLVIDRRDKPLVYNNAFANAIEIKALNWCKTNSTFDSRLGARLKFPLQTAWIELTRITQGWATFDLDFVILTEIIFFKGACGTFQIGSTQKEWRHLFHPIFDGSEKIQNHVWWALRPSYEAIIFEYMRLPQLVTYCCCRRKIFRVDWFSQIARNHMKHECHAQKCIVESKATDIYFKTASIKVKTASLHLHLVSFSLPFKALCNFDLFRITRIKNTLGCLMTESK